MCRSAEAYQGVQDKTKNMRFHVCRMAFSFLERLRARCEPTAFARQEGSEFSHAQKSSAYEVEGYAKRHSASDRELGGILAPAGAYRGWTCSEVNSYGPRKVFAMSKRAILVQTMKAAVLQHEVREAYNASAECRDPRRNTQTPLIIEIMAYGCD